MRYRNGRYLLAVAALLFVSVACRPGGGGTTTTTSPGGGGGGVEQTKTIRYGPLAIPGKNQPAIGPFAAFAGILGGQAGTGTAWNVPRVNIEKPCQECFITGIQANLKTAANQTANVYNGLWLHHMVLLVSNPNGSRQDATCKSGLQQVAIGASGGAERLFASGNERTPLAVSGAAPNYGYKMTTGDRLNIIYELMNDNDAAANVYMELTYKFKASTTGGMHNVKPVWLDANGCGVSEVAARTGAYQVPTNVWTSTVSGPILGAGGHAHDGATNVSIKKNGQQICDSVAKYGETPEFRPPDGGGMDHGGGGMDHGGMSEGSISSFHVCYNLGNTVPGDRFQAVSNYDDSQHMQMVHNGKLHSVMSIALVYIGQ